MFKSVDMGFFHPSAPKGPAAQRPQAQLRPRDLGASGTGRGNALTWPTLHRRCSLIPKKILFCTDFSDNSLSARLLALEYARVFGAQLFVLHVVNSRLLGYPTFADRIPLEISVVQKTIEEGVRQELELIINDCRRDLENVSGHFKVGAPVEEILAFAKERAADLIILGTHGWTGVKHLLLGSTAENVLRTAECAVLVVRSDSQ
jgi:universal stress protein A